MTRRTALEMLCVGLGSVQIASIDPETKMQGSAHNRAAMHEFADSSARFRARPSDGAICADDGSIGRSEGHDSCGRELPTACDQDGRHHTDDEAPRFLRFAAVRNGVLIGPLVDPETEGWIYDLTFDDVDVSWDLRCWFHLFGSRCRSNLPSLSELRRPE